MRQLISSLSATYHQKLEKVELWLLKKILSNDDITATDIVRCYGSSEALLDDLCESGYEHHIIDFALGSTTGHMRITEAAYQESQRPMGGYAC